MSVKITNVAIKADPKTDTFDWLLANVGDKITVTIDIEVETAIVASTKKPFIVQNKDGYVGAGWITDSASRFKDFKIGQVVNIVEYDTPFVWLGNYYTILDKIGNNAIQLTNVGTLNTTSNNTSISNIVIAIATPITAMKYKWNFIENDDQPTFASKVDGTEHLLVNELVNAASGTVLDMKFIGAKPYQIGSATIKGLGLDASLGYKSKFEITHNTYVTPFMLTQQWGDLLKNINADYFQNLKCLKAIFDIEAAYFYTDPNYLVTTQITAVDGNTGGFGENYNTALTNYYIDQVIYTRPSTEVIPSLELVATEIDVEIRIKNTVAAPFSNNNTKFALNFIKAPYDNSEYSGNSRTMEENFCFDRALQTVGSASVNGMQYGTVRQVLKDVTATYISTSEIRIFAKVLMDANVVSIITESQEARYMLFVMIQNHTLTNKGSDKTTLLIPNKFYLDQTDDGMIVMSNVFLKHTESNLATEGAVDINVFPEDEVVAHTQFYIDKNGRGSNVIRLTSIECRVKAKNSSTLEEFTLDNFKNDVSASPVIIGNQFFDFSLDRVFHIPTAEIRKAIKMKRRSDLDAFNYVFYQVVFPFLIRWEYWKKLLNVNDAFFDITEPQNGLNNFWHRYTTLADWGLYYELIVKATKDGVPLTFNSEFVIDSNDYDSNSDWTPNQIKSYDNVTNTLLYDGVSMKNFLFGYADTRIEASFTKVSGVPTLSNIAVNIGIEVFEEGGVDGRRRMTSYWVTSNDTWFKSTDGSDKAVLSLAGSTVKAKVLVDFSKLPIGKNKFKITARIYELPSGADGKITEAGIPKLTESGFNKVIE